LPLLKNGKAVKKGQARRPANYCFDFAQHFSGTEALNNIQCFRVKGRDDKARGLSISIITGKQSQKILKPL
jgi:hypothetical protein